MEISIKAWGREEILERNDLFIIKKLVVKPNSSFPIAFRKTHSDFLICFSGRPKISFGEGKDEVIRYLNPGDTWFVSHEAVLSSAIEAILFETTAIK
jgi:mannose-6-phosphate isomerase-like protein (cupin superfamily)